MRIPGDAPPNPYTTPGPGRAREPFVAVALAYLGGLVVALLSFAGWVLSWFA